MSRSNFLNNLQYCKYYCEENIWQLCAQSKFLRNAWVLFVSNPENHFVIWNQKLAQTGEPIVWDYHVILLAAEKEEFKIYDFDSRLPFGCDADFYFSNSFPNVSRDELPQRERGQKISPIIPKELSPQFLIQSSVHFREFFKSNRDHMKDEAGNFVEPEPSWKRISEDSNLNDYLKMDSKRDYILGLDEIRKTPWSVITEACHS